MKQPYDLIELYGIIFPFATALLIVLIVFITKALRDKSKNEVIMKAVEQGKELSPELFKDSHTPKKERDPLTSALVLIGAGIGIFVSFYIYFDFQLKYASFGFIPLFIGMGQLIAQLVNRREKKQ